MVSAEEIRRVLREVREGRKIKHFVRVVGDVTLCTKCGASVLRGATEHHRIWHEEQENE